MTDREAQPEIIEAEVEPVGPPPPRNPWKFIAGLAAIVALVAIGVLAWLAVAPQSPLRQPPVATIPVDDGRIAALEQRLENLAALEQRLENLGALEQRLATLEGQPQPAGDGATLDQQSNERLADLDRRMNALEQTLAASDNSAALNELRQQVEALAGRPAVAGDQANPEIAQRLAALEQQAVRAAEPDPMLTARIANLEQALQQAGAAQTQAATQSRSAALLLAAGQVRDAARRGGPFATELANLQNLLGDNPPPALSALQPFAEGGVPTVQELQKRFEGLAGDIVRTRPADGDNWWQAAMARLSGLVSVRRTGEVAGSEPDAVVARAEARLQQGDLAAAIGELAQLQGAPVAAAAPWLADARKRLALTQALNQLETGLLERMARPAQ